MGKLKFFYCLIKISKTKLFCVNTFRGSLFARGSRRLGANKWGFGEDSRISRNRSRRRQSQAGHARLGSVPTGCAVAAAPAAAASGEAAPAAAVEEAKEEAKKADSDDESGSDV